MPLYLPDANVLIHALREASVEHAACHRWLVNAAATGDDIGLCELVEVAFLRITTLPKLQIAPMAEALGFWQDDLWTYPHTRRLAAGIRHASLLKEMIVTLQLCGNDINDAWLAVLAIEHRATLVSTDRGFARFPGLRWLNPLDEIQK